MKSLLPVCIFAVVMVINLCGQEGSAYEPVEDTVITTGWADEAVTIGYAAAPSVFVLLFISTLVSEWNAGYFGIPGAGIIYAVPPVIFFGGRSVPIMKEIHHSRAQLGWILYALSAVPTAFAVYGFTTDLGATLPLTIASGVLGTASIIAMTSYAFARAELAREMINSREPSLNFGIGPVKAGAMIYLTYRF
ncbi:MAG TPA: hypothetical protein ENN61_04340 [Bacteroidaceae bacterium]|nr:hypothetical protein [Bacteroidaceae bacterium]